MTSIGVLTLLAFTRIPNALPGEFVAVLGGCLETEGVDEILDLLRVLSVWERSGRCPSAWIEGLHGHGGIAITDLLVLLGNWA